MKLPGWTGVPLHVLGGASLGALSGLLGLPGLTGVVLVAIWGYGREVRQHDWDLTLHQTLEGIAWGVGATLGWAIVMILGG